MVQGNVEQNAASEVRILFEALFQDMRDQGFGENTLLTISGSNRLGEVNIRLDFPGEMFVPSEGSLDSPEGLILKAYGDKMGYSYRSGNNAVRISVRRNYRIPIFFCALAALLALVVYALSNLLVDETTRASLLTHVLLPLERLFANAVLMIGAPMTFFSLLKNLADAYIVSEHSDEVRALQGRSVATSILAIALASVSFALARMVLSGDLGLATYLFGGVLDERSFGDILLEFIPSNIFDAFGATSPIPLIVVALLGTYALCTTGKHFDMLKGAVDACYALFSRMLHAVMATLPFFCFVAIFEVLADYGFAVILYIAAYFVVLVAGVTLLFISYAIRLRIRGVEVVPFIKKLLPLVHENLKIGSVIEATPFNIRYCAKHFRLNRQNLQKSMPVLAQTNLDGNAFLIMFVSLVLLSFSKGNVSTLTYLAIALLVLFLSFGAPNQPGSILIGLLIVTTYLQTFDTLAIAIYTEAFFGSVQNVVNAIGSVVLVINEDKSNDKKPDTCLHNRAEQRSHK